MFEITKVKNTLFCFLKLDPKGVLLTPKPFFYKNVRITRKRFELDVVKSTFGPKMEA